MHDLNCRKCSSALAQIVSDAGQLCAECLAASIRMRVSKSVKLQFALENGDVAMIAVSGGACSMALAHMIHSFFLDDWSRPRRGRVRIPQLQCM
jgi:ABC-type ATPase with predicted acetyltransferase domain